MKLSAILGLVLVVASLSGVIDADKRDKRTVKTILGFFGYKLVALGSTGHNVETFRPQTSRVPKVNRIKTVMPFFKEDASVESTSEMTSVTSTMRTSSMEPAPMEASAEVKTSTMTEASDEDEFEPLRIVLDDAISFSETTESDESLDEYTTKAAESSSSETSTESQDNIEQFARFDSLPDRSTPEKIPAFATEEIAEKLPMPALERKPEDQPMPALETMPEKLPLPALKETPIQSQQENKASMPMPVSPPIQTLSLPKSFEFFRSSDATSQYFDQQTFNLLQDYQMPPRPFAAPGYLAPDQFAAQRSVGQGGQYFNRASYY